VEVPQIHTVRIRLVLCAFAIARVILSSIVGLVIVVAVFRKVPGLKIERMATVEVPVNGIAYVSSVDRRIKVVV
jgi:hypothetical protein